MRPVFTSSAHQTLFERQGFLTVSVLTIAELDACRRLFEQIDPQLDKGFYTSLESENRSYRDLVNTELNRMLTPRIAPLFSNYKPLGYTFNVKTPRPDSATPLHLDDCHVDETHYISVNLWIPLVNTSPENGTLHILPGSHRIAHPIRAFGMGFPYPDFAEMIAEKLLPVCLQAGEVLLFDSRIIHGAPPNLSGKIRPAVVTGWIPQEATPIVYMRYDGLPENRLEIFEAPFEFYTHVRIDRRPEGFKSLGFADYVPPAFSAAEFFRQTAMPQDE